MLDHLVLQIEAPCILFVVKDIKTLNLTHHLAAFNLLT